MDAVNIPAKFEVRSFTRSWDNRGYSKKFGQSQDTPTLHFLPNFYSAFVRMDPLNTSAKLDVRSFTHSWDNRWYFKNLGSSWIRPPSLFSQIFKGLLFAWTLWIHLPSLKFVALSVSEIIGGTQKNLGSPRIRPRSIFSKIFHGLVFGWTLWIYLPNLQSVALAVPAIIVIAVLGWGCEPPFLGKEKP